MQPQPATRIRPCRACGKQYEYPLKGHPATRFHCDDCVTVPVAARQLAERLQARIRQLELTVKRLQDKLEGPGKAP